MMILITGGGSPAYFLCREILALGHDVTLIARSRDNCERIAARLKATVLHGDATERSMLEEARARSADALLAVTPKDHDNLVACQLARMEFGVPRTVACVNDPDNVAVFAKLGVDAVCWSSGVTGLVQMADQRSG